MTRQLFWIMALCAMGVVCRAGEARAAESTRLTWEPSNKLQGAVRAAVESTLTAFETRKLEADQLALTLIDLTDPAAPVGASHRGDVQIYPASVIKLFYLVAAHQWMEAGRLEDTAELRRAMSDMIVHSYNEATHYVIDLLTGTTSGPELSDDGIAEWFEKRDAVNRYFWGLGYANVNANKKPWCEGPYGRETQAINRLPRPRNMLTTEDTARLLAEIVTHRASTSRRCGEMLDLMRRDLPDPGQDPDGQARFTGPALPPGAKLWSKAGWTSQTRHDAAYIELPDGRRWVLVMFTVGHADERTILHTVAKELLDKTKGWTRVADPLETQWNADWRQPGQLGRSSKKR